MLYQFGNNLSKHPAYYNSERIILLWKIVVNKVSRLNLRCITRLTLRNASCLTLFKYQTWKIFWQEIRIYIEWLKIYSTNPVSVKFERYVIEINYYGK